MTKHITTLLSNLLLSATALTTFIGLASAADPADLLVESIRVNPATMQVEITVRNAGGGSIHRLVPVPEKGKSLVTLIDVRDLGPGFKELPNPMLLARADVFNHVVESDKRNNKLVVAAAPAKESLPRPAE